MGQTRETTGHKAAFGPAHWAPGLPGGEQVPGAWTKELLHSDHGDSFTLLRLAGGTKFELPGSADERVLVLDGELAVGDHTHRRGGYCAPGAETFGVAAGLGGCLALVLTGDRLGAPAEDVFSPQGWVESGPGQWFRLLLEVAFDETFDERVVGLSYFEPGSSAPRHPHPTAHRFLFLDGEADDELVFPDGSRETAHRRRGDFVDYPFPVQHQIFSSTGCMILFAHEPISTT